MNFQDFIENKKVRKAEPDIPLAKSLIAMAENHIETVKPIEQTDKTASTVMSDYYEAVREIIEAICAVQGYKIYSHEAFTYFLKENGETLVADKFDRFRKIRNSIHYYGKQANRESVKEDKKEIEKLIKYLKEKFLKDFT